VRIAAIDIGTNSIHMVIADAGVGEALAVLDREREVVQVGRGSFRDGRLRGDAMRRTAAALRRFVQLARRHTVDRILCTATAAVREARNGGDFQRLARHESGISPRVIPNEEEGRLIHLAVQAALKLDPRPALIVDIGGGSAQLVHVRGSELLKVVGVPLGALRLTETRLEHDPPSEGDLEALRRHVRKQLRAALETLGDPAPEVVYGSSGSIHALAGLAHWEEHGRGLPQINGHVLGLPALAELTRRLEGMSHDEREGLPGIDAARAEILVPGAIVLEQVLRLSGARSITLSDYGVREGLVIDWVKRHAQELSTLEGAGDLRMRSVLGLLARFKANDGHARHVAALSLRLFDEFERWHGLEAREREWLHFAALLHDLGAAVAYDGHAQHSAYIVRHGGLRGLTAHEIDIVASIARHHGGSRPRRRRDEAYAALPRRTRRAVRWLSAILRVAESLDRSHYQLVRDLRVRQRGDTSVIVVEAGRQAQLELWAARRRVADLARLVGHEVTVRPAAGERAVPRLTRRDAGAAPSPPRDAAPRAGDAVGPTNGRTRPAPARKLLVLPRRNASA
jgi:exopolyphosphatase/guanosine-5'-triphosphate,3'-diphosphate pyrophosphatase